MGFREDHDRRVATFPEAIRSAHSHSSNHRQELLAGTTCACFYCCTVFPTDNITEWIDIVRGERQTALCPLCGVDSVLGERAGFELSPEFLHDMKPYWF